MLAIASFLLFTVVVGVVSWHYSKKDDQGDAHGYFLASNSLPWYFVTGSLLLTNLSTEQMVGLNGGAYLNGAVVMAWEVIAAAALVLMALYFLPRYWTGSITTIPQFLERRFDTTTRRLLGAIFLLSLVLNFLPFVLYSGAVALLGLFNVPELLGLSERSALNLMVGSIGIVGAAYAVFGGLKAVAVSDSINGIGLLIGGLLIPILGIRALGDGAFLDGWDRLLDNQRERLNPIGSAESAVPAGTLFTGLMLVNIFYWCTNQTIVQRVFGARSLAEGQKGVLGAAFLKLIGPLYLVLPGILAIELLGPDLENGDFAYPRLVQAVLPTYLAGLFGAVMFGAILSSYNSALHSAATLFGLDLYKGMINPSASDRRTVAAGKIFAGLLAVLSMIAAPLVAQAPDGLYTLMKQINAIFNIPILAVVVMGIATRRVTAFAAKISLFLGMVIYSGFTYVLNGEIAGVHIHWLHFAGLNFAFLCIFMLLLSSRNPAVSPAPTEAKRLQGAWPAAKAASAAVLVLMVALYIGLYILGRT